MVKVLVACGDFQLSTNSNIWQVGSYKKFKELVSKYVNRFYLFFIFMNYFYTTAGERM